MGELEQQALDRNRGIFVGLSVEPVEKSLPFFRQYKNLNPIEVMDNTHVTCLYPEELTKLALAEWEAEKLEQTAARAQVLVGKLDLIGTVFRVLPVESRTGNNVFFTMDIDGEDNFLFDGGRKAASEAVEEVIGSVRIPQYSPSGYQVELTKSLRGMSGGRQLRSVKKPPTEWTIRGYSVEIRSVRPPQQQPRQHPVKRPPVRHPK